MGELYYPFATGPGANADETAWGNIFLGMGEPGVLIGEANEFAVSAPGGAAVKVDTGRAVCFGHYYELTAQTANIAVAANAGATRFDRVVIRFDFAADNAHVVVVTGTTSGPPALSANRAGQYDIPLAVIAVPNGASVTTGAITMGILFAAPVNSIFTPNGNLLHWNSAWGELDYDENASFTQNVAGTYTILGSLSVTATVPPNRILEVRAAVPFIQQNIGDGLVKVGIFDNASVLQQLILNEVLVGQPGSGGPVAGTRASAEGGVRLVGLSGTVTYRVKAETSTNTATITGGASDPGSVWIQLIDRGPAGPPQ